MKLSITKHVEKLAPDALYLLVQLCCVAEDVGHPIQVPQHVLATRLGWNQTKIKRTLAVLRRTGQATVTRAGGRKASTITLCCLNDPTSDLTNDRSRGRSHDRSPAGPSVGSPDWAARIEALEMTVARMASSPATPAKAPPKAPPPLPRLSPRPLAGVPAGVCQEAAAAIREAGRDGVRATDLYRRLETPQGSEERMALQRWLRVEVASKRVRASGESVARRYVWAGAS